MNLIICAANIMTDLTQICPKCKKEQMVPMSKPHKTLRCKYCGANIPPAKVVRGDQ